MQVVECDPESLSLVCENTEAQTCLQYQMRVLCDECDLTTTATSHLTPPKKLHCKDRWSVWINRDTTPGDGDREAMSTMVGITWMLSSLRLLHQYTRLLNAAFERKILEI